MPVIDALLAATARLHGLVLVTRNTADLDGLDVRLLNPFESALLTPSMEDPGMDAAYDRLKSRFARIATLGEARPCSLGCGAMMPPGGAAARGEQLAVLAGLAHDLLTTPAVADDLAAAEAAGEMGRAQLD